MESTLVCEPLAVARLYLINNVRKNNMVTHAKLAAQMLREAAIFFAPLPTTIRPWPRR
jgi:hypothetical protein